VSNNIILRPGDVILNGYAGWGRLRTHAAGLHATGWRCPMFGGGDWDAGESRESVAWRDAPL